MNATMTPETTTDTSTAEQTILDCQTKAQSLERERLNLAERLASAAGELETLQGEILSKERTFTPADQRDVPKLRAKRLELVQMRDDLRQLAPTIDAELQAVAWEVAAVHRVVASREYNVLAARQAQITATMAGALTDFETTVRECLREKQALAVQQQAIQRSQMGMQPVVPDPERLVAIYKRDLITVVSGYVVDADYSAVKQDWTTRTMNETGELRARS